jgi:hypothetical protein
MLNHVFYQNWNKSHFDAELGKKNFLKVMKTYLMLLLSTLLRGAVEFSFSEYVVEIWWGPSFQGAFPWGGGFRGLHRGEVIINNKWWCLSFQEAFPWGGGFRGLHKGEVNNKWGCPSFQGAFPWGGGFRGLHVHRGKVNNKWWCPSFQRAFPCMMCMGWRLQGPVLCTRGKLITVMPSKGPSHGMGGYIALVSGS